MRVFKIFLVEDSVTDALLVRETLQTLKVAFDLHKFADVPEALAALREIGPELPDLIIADLHLPSGDGLEVLRMVRSNPRFATVPVAIITGSVYQRDHNEAVRLGANGYVQKAMDVDTFIEELGRTIIHLLHRPLTVEPEPLMPDLQVSGVNLSISAGTS